MEKLIFPPFLEKGDKVIIISPSGKIEKEIVAGAWKRLASWGLKVKVGKHYADSYASFAGSIRHRLSDLQAAMDDETAKVIFCSRGGYGAQHLIGKLDFTKFREHPKWLIGFSDITALHCYFQAEGFASIHGPMGRHLTEEPADDFASEALRKLLFGEYQEATLPCIMDFVVRVTTSPQRAPSFSLKMWGSAHMLWNECSTIYA